MAEHEPRLDPDLVASAGRDLAAAGTHLTEQRSEAGAEVAALSGARPWGTDDIGEAFERTYRPIEQQVLRAWEKLGGHVTELGDAVAVRVERTDRKLS